MKDPQEVYDAIIAREELKKGISDAIKNGTTDRSKLCFNDIGITLEVTGWL